MKKRILHELIPLENSIFLLERQKSYKNLISTIEKNREEFYDVLSRIDNIEMEAFPQIQDRMIFLKQNTKTGGSEYTDCFLNKEIHMDSVNEIVGGLRDKLGRVKGGIISRYLQIDPKTS
ncbi:unnamed protein product, partial [marine sediment metagenome]